jgi:hypothetical protein
MTLPCNRPIMARHAGTRGTGLRCSRPVMTAALALLFLSAGARAAEPDSPIDRVTVLDAGTFLVVEAHQAALGEVLEHLRARLDITFSNTERVDLTHIVDGRRIGSAFDIMKWLVPNHSFVLLYGEQKPNDPRRPRLERIGFLNIGTAATTGGTAPGSAVAAPSESIPGGVTAATRPASSGGVRPDSGLPASAGGGAEGPDLRTDGSKPDLPSTPMSEIKSVAEQLRAGTPDAQLEIERQARVPDRPGPPPEFLRPQSDAAQTTLQQQTERSQALAVEQLRTLMEAFKAACRSKGDGPC